MHKMIFVNLPITDVQRSRDFFTAVGYTINEKFSDENAISVELGENIAAMLLKTDFFGTFHEATTAAPSSTLTTASVTPACTRFSTISRTA